LALLTAGCARVQPHLTLPNVAVGDPTFVATLEALAGAPVTEGNVVRLLLNGDEIFPAQLKAIRNATRTISYAQYVYEDGPPAREIADALAERCRAGVRVHVLLDGFGSLGMPPDLRTLLETSGCRVATFRPLSLFAWRPANHRNHRRILVVDGRIGFTGGSGASHKWMGNGRLRERWRETDVRMEGPGVVHLQGAFAENWLEATGELLGGSQYFRPAREPGRTRVQIVRSSPAGGSYAMYTMFLLAIAAARHSIHITNPYFVPDERMRDQLLEAAGRGVRVVLLLPGEIDHNLVRQASRAELGPLLKAGVKIYEYRAGLLHAKTMVVDGRWATVGSTNLDNRSFALNEELNVAVYDRGFAAQLERVFAADLAHARPLDYARWSQRGLKTRLLELLALPIRDQI
jgi:cardiolipin synthase